MRVVLDTMILCWGIRGFYPEKGPLSAHAKDFIDYLASEKATIIVPAPVVSEFLAGVPLERQPEAIEVLSSQFRIGCFDLRAAACLGDLLARKLSARSEELSKVRVKFDCLVLACALSQKADIIYSHDDTLIRMAEKKMRAEKMPAVPQQLPLGV